VADGKEKKWGRDQLGKERKQDKFWRSAPTKNFEHLTRPFQLYDEDESPTAREEVTPTYEYRKNLITQGRWQDAPTAACGTRTTCNGREEAESGQRVEPWPHLGQSLTF